eukprot:CAMPEP_0201555480 /NCGR_PEP_ID=MMETSP0173_2-20130828/49331_1 /ASSEMBLY_ACC=CAM_ASM_000268 /TAXON_ID=218659 /ORGANISM="Vexillifera sp., Strain DIVA3 564/2" /LENGTH=258 /DNA_ID=CAMNT_0047967291 /DNA_START=150 /DNA_END=923 /DNA_ORIENTATION=-
MTKGGEAWRGYFRVGEEFTSGKPDQKEGYYFGREQTHEAAHSLPMHGKNIYYSLEQKQVVEAYLSSLEWIGQQLLSLIGQSVGLQANYFQKRFEKEPTILFRWFNYPQQPESAPQWGVQEHTDYGFVTLLLQDDSGGLQVLNTRTMRWIEAPPIDNTLVCNIGDMLELWLHGLIRATPHRVMNKQKHDRLSFPFFFDPSWNASLQPIPIEMIDQQKLLDHKQYHAAAAADVYQRWDGLDLETFSQSQYGDFLWQKVKK